MKEVLKTAYTLWCLLLLVVFTFGACAAFLAVIVGASTDQDGMAMIGLLCCFTFGWGAGRYSKIFTDRVEKTKKAALDWDDKDDDESDYNN
jgi:hypothetical protein